MGGTERKDKTGDKGQNAREEWAIGKQSKWAYQWLICDIYIRGKNKDGEKDRSIVKQLNKTIRGYVDRRNFVIFAASLENGYLESNQLDRSIDR